MDSPQAYLLKKIMLHSTNGLDSLGKLNASHIKDIAEVMRLFTLETITELVERINKGETVNLGNGTVLSFKKNKKQKANHKQQVKR